MSQRFFSKEQVREYEETAGKGCEWLVNKGSEVIRCTQEYVESGHLQRFALKGKTELDNLVRECRPHHSLQHFLDGEPQIAQLIINRMTDPELGFLKQIAKSIGWNPHKGE